LIRDGSERYNKVEMDREKKKMQQNLEFQQFSYSENTQVYTGVNNLTPPPGQYYPQPVSWQSIQSAFTAASIGNEPPLLQGIFLNTHKQVPIHL
jgi:hypothetical protein